MKVTFDTGQIDKLGEAMKRYAGIMPTNIANSALRKATRPMYRAAQAEVPVSKGGQTRTSLRYRKRGKAADSFSQGGATRRDLRVKTVTPKSNEVGRILIGVSKRSGKVGWRTIFITHGTKMRKTKKGRNTGRTQANNFLQRAYDQTIGPARIAFTRIYREAFSRWAKTNLPQGKI
ncbi:HK97 gp10 family phage protein [Dyadobacter sp. CY323]|uniref:HK97 gp10 family phage protein n=1 Tax=Dyadobacter sp. CY323 TaxID=2907302 RepID=UPI001F255673|nr:HK97 gp10 family phage protein [Dyadobacter sp. CY323]MCE6992100.1 hypothetical protein [Dyadobacter sp. CY323]